MIVSVIFSPEYSEFVHDVMRQVIVSYWQRFFLGENDPLNPQWHTMIYLMISLDFCITSQEHKVCKQILSMIMAWYVHGVIWLQTPSFQCVLCT